MTGSSKRAVADTSVFIGLEANRFDPNEFTDYMWAISVVTLGELRVGVLRADGPEETARRLSTFQLAQRCEPLPIDEWVTDTWALLVSRLRAAGRKIPVNDSWIAATALARGLPIVTQDDDYHEVLGLEVIKL